MFKKDKLAGLTGADLIIGISDVASDMGAPYGRECLDIAQDLAINGRWREYENVPDHQRTALQIILAAWERAEEAKSEQAMVEVAVYGAMLMARVTQQVERS